MKRFLSILLALTMILSVCSMAALAANPFTDVPVYEWYYADIDNAYQNNLINGKTATQFKPNDFLTYAEAVKLAAVMHQRYTTGAVTLQNGQPWYQPYVEYCRFYRIISTDYAWNQPATRAGYMEIFAHALPAEAMDEINNIPDGSIPDVPSSHPQADSIYKLYRVGILQGVNIAHACNPASNIKRGEVAAILTRMMDSSKRIEFTMGDGNNDGGLNVGTQAQGGNVRPGDVINPFVEVEGGKAPYTYQWETKDNGNWIKVPGATSPKLRISLDDAKPGDILTYRCIITDATGKSITGDPIVFIVVGDGDLSIKSQPQEIIGKTGETVKMSVEADGGRAPYSYQWQIFTNGNWVNSPSDTKQTMTYRIPTGTEGTQIRYRCIVTDAYGDSVISQEALLTVYADDLRITTQPRSVTAMPGNVPVFNIEVTGGRGPYTFDWYLGEEGGGTSVKNMYGVQTRDNNVYGYSEMQVLIYDSFKYTEENRYFFYCVVTDANGHKVTSKAFDINVLFEQFSANGTGSSRVRTGDNAVLNVNATGGQAPYTYTWMGYSNDAYSQGFTTNAVNWDGVQLSSDNSTLVVNTGDCDATAFTCEVRDATGTRVLVEFTFTVY